jgi:hypothetical protein
MEPAQFVNTQPRGSGRTTLLLVGVRRWRLDVGPGHHAVVIAHNQAHADDMSKEYARLFGHDPDTHFISCSRQDYNENTGQYQPHGVNTRYVPFYDHHYIEDYQRRIALSVFDLQKQAERVAGWRTR